MLTTTEADRVRLMLSCGCSLFPSIRPALQVREAALLRMLRGFRLEHGATPQYRRLSDLLGWKAQAVADSLALLTSAGFILPDRDGSRPLETIEAAGFAEIVPMIAALLDIATTDPRNPADVARSFARVHPSAVALLRTVVAASEGSSYREHLSPTAHRARSQALSALSNGIDPMSLPVMPRVRPRALPALPVAA